MANNTAQPVDIFGLILAEMAHKWRRVLDQRLRPGGLSQSTWRTLYYAKRAETGILQKDLAVDIGIEGPSLVRILDLLEEDGLISRQVSVADRRGKIIRVTAKGEAILQEVQAVADDVRHEMLEGLSSADLTTCLDVFERIDNNVTQMMPGKNANNAPNN